MDQNFYLFKAMPQYIWSLKVPHVSPLYFLNFNISTSVAIFDTFWNIITEGTETQPCLFVIKKVQTIWQFWA